jgi:hypothetical protein
MLHVLPHVPAGLSLLLAEPTGRRKVTQPRHAAARPSPHGFMEPT